MYSGYKMVIDDPSKFHLLTEDMQKTMLKAAAATVNIQAFLTRKNAVQTFHTDFTLRNDFTEKSIYVAQAPKEAMSFSEIESHVGALDRASYLERQETGGVHKPTNGGQLSIPTIAARSGSRRKPVEDSMYRRKVNKKIIKYNPYHKGTGKSALVSAAEVAYEQKKFLKYNKNIYRVTSFTKSGDNIKFNLQMIYFRGKSETQTKATHWLTQAAQKPAQDAQSIFNSQMKKLEK